MSDKPVAELLGELITQQDQERTTKMLGFDMVDAVPFFKVIQQTMRDTAMGEHLMEGISNKEHIELSRLGAFATIFEAGYLYRRWQEEQGE